MRYSVPFFLLALAIGFAPPVTAQDNNISMAYFMTVDDANAPDLEEGMRRHQEWHRDQNDTWSWGAWQAITGAPEYAYLSGDHAWADFDNPGVDPAEDGADWAETGGPHTESNSVSMWMSLDEISHPGGEQPAVVQVFEFTLNPGGQEAFMHFAQKFVEAVRSTNSPIRFEWSQVVSGPGGSTHFVAVPAANFAAFGLRQGGPPAVLREAYGATEARQLLEMFAGAMTAGASRIWVYRPDLSYMPD